MKSERLATWVASLHASHFTLHVLSLPLGGVGGGFFHVELVGSEADNGETVSNENDGGVLEVGIDVLPLRFRW